jgi:very-short-patch-repair endonuclease
MKPKVYLAGKITKHGWRDAIVPWGSGKYPGNQNDDETGVDWNRGDAWDPRFVPQEWAPRECAQYSITGPFFIGCDHGCTHGESTHATAGGCVQSHYGDMRAEARWLCLKAINRSDIVFAWLDDATAYGTIAELGYASALGKRIVIAVPPCPTERVHEWIGARGLEEYQTCGCMRHGDTWFVAGMPGVAVIEATDPHVAWGRLLADVSMVQMNEVERMFWDANKRQGRKIADLVPQHELKANGKNYRLDFYSPSKKCAIEVDGLAYHNGQASFVKDRNRQRDLEMSGIRVLRFAAKEVMDDSVKCVLQAAEWAASV